MKLKFIALVLALLSPMAYAQSVSVTDAWARPAVVGQKATGAFMKITSKEGAKLVAVQSPAAGVAQVHEMKIDGGVMSMRAVVGGLDLPAGKAVELKPGGYHLMLMDLKGPIEKGSTLQLTLTFRNANGVEGKLEVKAAVSTQAPAHGEHHD